MSDRKEPVVHRKKRGHGLAGGWSAIPMAAKVSAIVCVGILLLIPLIRHRRGGQSVETRAASALIDKSPAAVISTPAYVSDLEVISATRDAATRTVSGTVRNKSQRLYTDIQVSYFSRDTLNRDAGVVLGTIDRIGPGETAKFRTGPFGPNAQTWDLREISGNPR